MNAISQAISDDKPWIVVQEFWAETIYKALKESVEITCHELKLKFSYREDEFEVHPQGGVDRVFVKLQKRGSDLVMNGFEYEAFDTLTLLRDLFDNLWLAHRAR
jgi:hypothetical protein